MFRFHARELDPYRTLAEAATVVTLRRRIASSEAAKQEAESQSNQRRTRFPRNQATILTLADLKRKYQKKYAVSQTEHKSKWEIKCSQWRRAKK